MGPMLNHASTYWGTWRVPPEGMSQMFRLLFLGNGWAECIEIWYALEDPLLTAYAVVTGGVSMHVRTCRDTPTPRFCISKRLGRLCSNFVCCGSLTFSCGSLTKCLSQVMGGVHLHVRTRAPFFHKCFTYCYSVTARPIVLRFGMHLGTH